MSKFSRYKKVDPKTAIGKLNMSSDYLIMKHEEAEVACLGSMILDATVIPDVMAILGDGYAFFIEKHRAIYEAIVWLSGQSGEIDIVRLHARLQESNLLQDVGGVDYLVMLAESVPSAKSAPYYAKIIKDARVRFDCYQAIIEAAVGITETPKEIESVVGALEAALVNRRAEAAEDKPESIGDIADREAMRAVNGGIAVGIPTGFEEVDRITGGLNMAEVVVVAARPSVGKTAVALAVANHVASHGIGVLFFSIEMSKTMIGHRILSYMTKINMVDIRNSNLDEQRKQDLIEASGNLKGMPLYVDGQASSPSMIRARIRQELAKHEVKLVIIDYLQLMQSDAKKEGYGTRDNEVGTMSRAIKMMAREFNLAVILLSQLNRGAESREGNKPRLSDLRESGSIEQDADSVWLLHQDDYYHRHDPNYERNYIGEINIAKQRNGPTDIVKVDLCPDTGQWLPTSNNNIAKVFGDPEKSKRRRH